MNVCIGTKNQKKIDTVERLWAQFLDDDATFEGFDAASGVAEAPRDDDVIRGAENRARACHQSGSYDYAIGIESGLVHRHGDIFEEAWVVVISSDGQIYKGYSSGLMLPEMVTKDMERGRLHNEIMQELDQRLNLPDDNCDTWSRYSGGQLSRVSSFEEALRNVLVQITNVENNLYKM